MSPPTKTRRPVRSRTARPGNLPPDRLFLLVVDLQPVFFPVIPEAATLTARCRFAVEAARGLGIPIGFTEQVPDRLGPADSGLLAAAPNAPVWSKNTFSALADTTVRKELASRGTRQLLLCGIETTVCIYQTARDALVAGLAVTILSDGIGCRREADGRAAIEDLIRQGARVLAAETVFYEMLHDAGHPFFREYTRLVKRFS